MSLRQRRTSIAAIMMATIIGCSGSGDSRDTGDTRDTPTPKARTLDTMSPQLTRDLTPALARERFGAPDVETGSGLIIYKYALEGGDTLMLGFPGFAPITYAQRIGANGALVPITLR